MDQSNLNVLGGVVDRLAAVKATIADLKAEEAQLKQLLIDSGNSAVDGTAHRASISEVQPRPSIDWRAIAEHFNPSRQLVTAHTTLDAGYFVVRVAARRVS